MTYEHRCLIASRGITPRCFAWKEDRYGSNVGQVGNTLISRGGRKKASSKAPKEIEYKIDSASVSLAFDDVRLGRQSSRHQRYVIMVLSIEITALTLWPTTPEIADP